MGIASSSGRSNDEMVNNLVEGGQIRYKPVEFAMRLVDRGDYFPEGERENAYKDMAWKEPDSEKLGPIHLSAPCIYSNALEFLDIRPGMSFLNVGSGTGYFSTLAGFLLTETGTNHGVEIYENVVEYAEEHLRKILQKPASCAYSFCIPEFFVGSGLCIRNAIQYDRIYCGSLVPEFRRCFFAQMLKIGGSLVMPYSTSLIRIERTGEHTYRIYRINDVSFSKMILPDVERPFTRVEVALPGHAPKTLQDVCRLTIRRCVRNHVHSAQKVRLHFEVDLVRRDEDSDDNRRRDFDAVLVLDNTNDDDDNHADEGEFDERADGILHEDLLRENPDDSDDNNEDEFDHEDDDHPPDDGDGGGVDIGIGIDPNLRGHRMRQQPEDDDEIRARIPRIQFVHRAVRRQGGGVYMLDLLRNPPTGELATPLITAANRTRPVGAPIGLARHDLESVSVKKLGYVCDQGSEFSIVHEEPRLLHSLPSDVYRHQMQRQNRSSTNPTRGLTTSHAASFRRMAAAGISPNTIYVTPGNRNVVRNLSIRLNPDYGSNPDIPEVSSARTRPISAGRNAPLDPQEPTSTVRLNINIDIRTHEASSSSSPEASTSSSRTSGKKRAAPDSFNEYDSDILGNVNVDQEMRTQAGNVSHEPSGNSLPAESGEIAKEKIDQNEAPKGDEVPIKEEKSAEEEKKEDGDESDPEIYNVPNSDAGGIRQRATLATFYEEFVTGIRSLPLSKRLIRFLLYQECEAKPELDKIEFGKIELETEN